VVIDNTSHFRMEKDIALVVPEVNESALKDYKKTNIIANPNCSTIQMVVALNPLKKLGRIKRVIVSTDSEEIATVARDYGAESPFMRPAELARDDSPEWLAWRHALKWLLEDEGRLPDAMVSLPATAPLRQPEDIENCLDAFEGGQVDVVVTATSAHRNPWFNMVTIDQHGAAALVNSPEPGTINRRQDTPPVYDLTTVAYVARPHFVLSQPGIFAGRVKAVRVPSERSIDIDTLLDFRMAEFLLNPKYTSPLKQKQTCFA
jgi:N-acylneuraminate cytidylyltransferase